MKIDWKGMRFKNWTYLMIFSLTILAVLWILQFVLFGFFYERMKLAEVTKVGQQVTTEYEGNADNFSQSVMQYAFSNNMRILLLNSDGRAVNQVDGMIHMPGIRSDPMNDLIHIRVSELQERLLNSKNGSVHFLKESPMKDMNQAVYIAKVEPSKEGVEYIYITSAIPPVDSTATVLLMQFVIITVLVFLFSIIAARVISNRMAKPIIALTQSAQGLAKGEFHLVFPQNGMTEIRQLSDALGYATGELAQLDCYRKELLANISHDLKTPLTIIRSYSEILRDIPSLSEEKRKKHCEMIMKETDRLTEMVNEILELSRLESGAAQIPMRCVDISRIVRETADKFQIFTQQDGYRFEWRVEDSLLVTGNEEALKRVIYNLVSNAVNYTGEDKRVFVSLANADGTVVFTVKDTGKGIPESEQKNIWDRYYKSQDSHTRSVVGTGLGLSIVKAVLTLHGAAFGVNSREGQGSTFWFSLKKYD